MLSVASKSAFTEGVTAFEVVLLGRRFGGGLSILRIYWAGCAI